MQCRDHKQNNETENARVVVEATGRRQPTQCHRHLVADHLVTKSQEFSNIVNDLLFYLDAVL